MKLGIIAMFKNEAMGIREWLEHYKWQQVDRILLLNNNSTDGWQDEVKDFHSFIDVVPVTKNHAQTEHYNTIGMSWLKANKIDIVGVVDLDEYVYCADGKSLKENLEKLFADTSLSKVQLTWRLFGSSGHVLQPASIRRGFTWRKKNDPSVNVKCFSRVRDLISLQIHDHEVRGKTIRDPPGIYLNHYVIQSQEFFKKVKMTRGDGQHTSANSTRNWNYFQKSDHRDIEDLELKRQLNSMNHRGGATRKRKRSGRRRGSRT